MYVLGNFRVRGPLFNGILRGPVSSGYAVDYDKLRTHVRKEHLTKYELWATTKKAPRSKLRLIRFYKIQKLNTDKSQIECVN